MPQLEQSSTPVANAVRGARRTAVIVVIVSLTITAVVGILALLSGDFGETQGKILLTTLVMAAFSITALCHLAIASRPFRAVGFVGIAVSAAALVCALVLIWTAWSGTVDFDWLLRALGVLSVVAVSLAQANLLLVLGERRARGIRIALVATIAAIGIAALLLVLPIATAGDVPGSDADAYWRVFGVIAILDVLGSIVLPISSRFVREPGGAGQTPGGGVDTVETDESGHSAAVPGHSTTPARPGGSAAGPHAGHVTLAISPQLLARVDAWAVANGISRDAAAELLLDEALSEE